jgi:hypothetical protein
VSRTRTTQVCDCPQARHEHGTRSMYDFHSCGCGPCGEANAAYSRDRRRRLAAGTELPVCDCPRTTHRHGTRIMYNRHQCPCTPCGDANLEYVRNYTRLPVCDCKRAGTQHEHGTRLMYAYHRCRCAPCTSANTEYDRQAKAHKPRITMADGDRVRARIAELRAAGLLMVEIADLCAVNPKVLDYAVYGRNGRPPATVRQSTLDALLAIRHKDIVSVEIPPGRRVDGASARRQVQSLHAFGWGSSVIAQRTGAAPSSISHLLSGSGLLEELRLKIDALYNELHGVEAPVATVLDRKRSTHAKTKAAAHGWTADTASDFEYGGYALAS